MIRKYLKQRMIVDGKKINYLFAVASPMSDTMVIEKLKQEIASHGDVLISIHEDNRRTIPITILDTFLWVRDNCRQAKYVVKTDGDTWVHLGNLIHYLKALNESRVFCGKPKYIAKRTRTNYRGVKVLPYDYPRDVKLALGGGYILSGDLIPFVNIGVQYLDVFIPGSEDIVISSIINMTGIQMYTDYKGYAYYLQVHDAKRIPRDIIFAHNLKSRIIKKYTLIIHQSILFRVCLSSNKTIHFNILLLFFEVNSIVPYG